jgi:hypothetical protein
MIRLRYFEHFLQPLHASTWWRGVASLQNKSQVLAASGPLEQDGVDIFTRKLQQKTEMELEELVERRESTLGDSTSTETDVEGDRTEGTVKEIGGPQGPEPTRFGDWERAGRCSDF